MSPEKRAKKLSKEFLALKEQEKNIILGIARALAYAAKEGNHCEAGTCSDKKGIKNEKQMV